MEGHEALLLELECPVCSNYMTPPIRQCSTGHSICEPCRNKLEKCPLCQSFFTNSRNLTLEALAQKMKYPCENQMTGCKEMLSFGEKAKHEKHCKHRGIKCAMHKCPWIGRAEDILSHWESKPKASKPFSAKNVGHAKIKVESRYTNIVKAHEEVFWFKYKLEKGIFYFAVQYIGKPKNAQKYYYEIEVLKPGLPKSSVQHSEYCACIELEDDELFKESNCIQMHMNSLRKFVVDDQVMYYMRVGETKHPDEKGNTNNPNKKKDQKIDKSKKQQQPTKP